MPFGDAGVWAQIAARPEDDAPRLALAEWMVAHGDPRGEFIRLQCTQARAGNTPELQARIGAILRVHEEEWTAAAGIRGALTTFSRGFPAALIGKCSALIACREALRTQPITSLTVTSGVERLPELMAMPEVSRIRSLKLSAVLGDYGRREVIPARLLESLAQSPYWGGIETAGVELALEPGALDDEGARALARAAWLPRLEKLAIAQNRVTAVAMSVLAPRLVSLRSLALAGCDIGESGAEAIATSPMRKLDFLWLAETRIDAGGIAALASSPVLASVTRLDVAGNYAGDAAACAIARSSYAGALRELVFCENSVTSEGAEALAGSTALRSLEVLELHDNRIGHAGVAAFATGRGLSTLRRLGITRNELYTGKHETFTAGSEAAGDLYGGTYQVEVSRDQLATRFAHRQGLVIA